MYSTSTPLDAWSCGPSRAFEGDDGPPRLLLGEADPALRIALGRSLRLSGHEVVEADDGHAADAMLRRERFHLAVLGTELSLRLGLEVLAALRARRDRTPVLMIGKRRSEVADRVRCLDLGADDHLSVPFEVDEFMARVRALLRRPAPLREELRSVGRLSFDATQSAFYAAGEPLALSRRERTLLQALFRRDGRVVSREYIVQALGGHTSDEAVDSLVYRLRRRVAASGVQIRTIRGLGYVLEGPGSQRST